MTSSFKPGGTITIVVDGIYWDRGIVKGVRNDLVDYLALFDWVMCTTRIAKVRHAPMSFGGPVALV